MLLDVSCLMLAAKVECYHSAKKMVADEQLRGNVSHCGQHGDAAVLQLGLTTSLEVLNAAIGSEASRIPEPRSKVSLLFTLLVQSKRTLLCCTPETDC